MLLPTWIPLDLVEQTVKAMLAPTDSVPFDQWRALVEESARALTGADAALLLYPDLRPHPEAHRIDEADDEKQPTSGVRFGDPPAGVIPGEDADASEAAGDERGAVSMFVRLAPGAESWLTVRTRDVRDESFQARAADRLRSVLPAFRFAARSRWKFGVWRMAFATVLDAIDHPGLLCSEAGRVLHANRALADLPGSHSSAPRVRGAMEQAARRVARSHAASGNREVADRDVITGAGVFRLRTRWIDGSAFDGAASILVFADLRPGEAPETGWAERFNLTEREREIAQLLGRGRTNREIASALNISQYTVQNHVRKVLTKLNVRSRAAVAARLSD